MSFSPGGVDWDTFCATAWQWTVNGSGLPAASVLWGGQDAPRPAAPAIICRISNIAEIGQPWEDTTDNILTFSAAVTPDAAADTLTAPAHGLGNGDGPFQFSSTGTLPGGVVALTDYWVIVVDANTLKIATTYANTGGAQPAGAANPKTPLDITGVGSGTITMASTTTAVPAGKEILDIARCYLRVTLELRCHSKPVVGLNVGTSILNRVKLRRKWQTQQDLIQGINVGLIDADRVRAVDGIRDASLFEPRAYLDVHFCVAAEETEFLTRIDTATILDQVNNRTFQVGT